MNKKTRIPIIYHYSVTIFQKMCKFVSSKSNRNYKKIHLDSLKEVFQPLSKIIMNIYKDLEKLYSVVQQDEYENFGKKLPVDKLFDLNDEKILKDCILWFAECLKTPYRDFIHVFDLKPTSSLQHSIYNALVQGLSNFSYLSVNSFFYH